MITPQEKSLRQRIRNFRKKGKSREYIMSKLGCTYGEYVDAINKATKYRTKKRCSEGHLVFELPCKTCQAWKETGVL